MYEETFYGVKLYRLSLLLSRVNRKPAYFICEKKGADQLRGNRTVDQRLRFHYCNIDNTIPLTTALIRNFKPITNFCSCTAWFVPVLVGNPDVRFSNDATHLRIFHFQITMGTGDAILKVISKPKPTAGLYSNILINCLDPDTFVPLLG